MLLGEIAQQLDLELRGDATIGITGIAPLKTAGAGQISFLANPKFKKELQASAASAVILHPDMQDETDKPVLLSTNPYLAFARLTALFNDEPAVSAGVHPSAVVDTTAQVAASAAIGANAVIGAHVVIGEYSVIDANTVVHDRSVIGTHCHLHANVTVYHNVRIGNHVNIHSGAVIGADGFGFAPTGDKQGQGWQKIYQLGGVRIGNHVEVGANTCIDRGALGDTVLEDGVILDNLIQIGHNCELGRNTAMAACTAVAGSSIIGANCTIGGASAIAGHLHIVDGVHVTGFTLVTGSITQPGSYSSGTAMMPTREWRKSAVRFSQLESLHRRVKNLEKNTPESSSAGQE